MKIDSIPSDWAGFPHAHIQGLKQTRRKAILYWEVYFGNTLVDQNNSISLLRHKWKNQPGVSYRSVR